MTKAAGATAEKDEDELEEDEEDHDEEPETAEMTDESRPQTADAQAALSNHQAGADDVRQPPASMAGASVAAAQSAASIAPALSTEEAEEMRKTSKYSTLKLQSTVSLNGLKVCSDARFFERVFAPLCLPLHCSP